jgi:hypothetical protein
MKNIFTLLIGGLLTTSAFANNITLTVPNNRNYQVMIDGRNVSSNNYSNSNTIYLNNLQYGQHSIEVYRMKKNGWGNKNRPVYSSSFNSSPQYDLNITVDNNGRIQMYQSRSNDYGRNDRGNNNRGGYGTNNDRRDKNKKHDDGDDDDDREYRGNNGGYNNGGYDNRKGDWNNNRSNQAMSDYDFNQLVQKINKQWLGKMGTARDGLSNNYFNTYQVRQILQIFSSESDRLELAKLSYRNVVDQQNFRQLYDLFSYQSQTELDRYTRDFRY